MLVFKKQWIKERFNSVCGTGQDTRLSLRPKGRGDEGRSERKVGGGQEVEILIPIIFKAIKNYQRKKYCLWKNRILFYANILIYGF